MPFLLQDRQWLAGTQEEAAEHQCSFVEPPDQNAPENVKRNAADEDGKTGAHRGGVLIGQARDNENDAKKLNDVGDQKQGLEAFARALRRDVNRLCHWSGLLKTGPVMPLSGKDKLSPQDFFGKAPNPLGVGES